MHRRTGNKNKEIEQRLKNLILKARPDKPVKTKPREIATTLLFATSAIVLTAPLWSGWAYQPEIVKQPVYYNIKRVSIEYPDDMEPIIRLRPIRSGCASMPQIKTTSASQTI